VRLEGAFCVSPTQAGALGRMSAKGPPSMPTFWPGLPRELRLSDAPFRVSLSFPPTPPLLITARLLRSPHPAHPRWEPRRTKRRPGPRWRRKQVCPKMRLVLATLYVYSFICQVQITHLNFENRICNSSAWPGLKKAPMTGFVLPSDSTLPI
jgi:hypothetical protein